MMSIIISDPKQLGFGAPESEVEPIEQFDLIHGLATYVLTSSCEVRDGDTFGRSETERIRVTYGPSMWDETITVTRCSPRSQVGPCGFAGS